MTPEQIAKWAVGGDFPLGESERLGIARVTEWIEQAIIAAIEEERKTRQHQFVGRTDRGCELCGEPDRDEIHIFSRETYRNWLNLAVAEEREACAKIANGIEARYAIGSSNYAEGATTAARIIGDDIRARGCNNSATETYSKEEKIR